jgi:hypothetical protein
MLCWAIGKACVAAPIDESRLPPPAPQQIDFARDIKPILQNNCLKCHSNEKPKSGLRLTSRESALKGGENGPDILPGQSANSPLIHNVARLVPDMEMPPEGRGTPLTPEQVGLLRAWIDQGVVWETVAPEPKVEATTTPTVGWTTVHGDAKKFRELYWQREGWNGSLEEFEMTDKPGPDSKVTLGGHVLLDDYRLTLLAQKDDLGFTRFGWSQFRKYYDDTGGYNPLFSPPAFDLNRDLHLDVGRAWADFGLTLPRWPRIVLGYEYQYRDGTEATLEWGAVSHGTLTNNIYPGFKGLSEKVHILKLDVDYELAGFELSDNLRGEWYKLGTYQSNELLSTNGSPSPAFNNASERQSYFLGANAFHMEKQFTGWLFASGGYLYSKLRADGSVDVGTLNPQNQDMNVITTDYGWTANQVELERESHVFSLSGLVGPWEGLSLSLGVQNEWTRQMGMSVASNTFTFNTPPFNTEAFSLENLAADLDRRIFSQTVGLRFTKIPFTTLFGEARFQQESVAQFENETDGENPFLLGTEATSHLNDFRAGFNTSPWRRVAFTAQYRRSDNQTDYDNFIKDFYGNPPEGYPGFIHRRELASDEADGKLSLQWAAWLRTSLSYQWRVNHYRTATDAVSSGISPGGELLAGEYDSHNVSLNATLTPWRRLFLSSTLTYENARTVTAANGSPSIQPYAGDIYSAVVSGNYALNDKTSLEASYAFSTAHFAQDNFALGLPLGLNYHQHTLQAGVKHQLAKGKTLGLQYRFYHYDEPTSGTLNNFEAHAIFATLAFHLP